MTFRRQVSAIGVLLGGVGITLAAGVAHAQRLPSDKLVAALQ